MNSRIVVAVVACLSAVVSPSMAQQDTPPPQTLFTNVRVFDGTSDSLSSSTNVLVEGNLIKQISSSARARAGETVHLIARGAMLQALKNSGHRVVCW